MASQLVGRERMDFWLLSFGQLLVFCGFFSFFQFPLYIKALGGGEQEIGIIMGVGTLAATLLLPWITAMVERLDRKWMMLAGIVLLELSTLAFVMTTAPNLLMAVFMAMRGLGFSIYINAGGAYVAQILPPQEKSRWIGINFGFNQVAIGLGPLLGELVIRKVNFPFFFFMSAAFVYAGMLLVLPISARPPVPPETRFQAWQSLTGFFRQLSGPRFLTPFLTLLLLAGALGGVFTFTATYCQLLGISSGLFFASYAITNAATRFGGAGLADRFGRTRIVIPTLVIMSGGIFLFSVTSNIPQMITAAVLIGIGFGLSNPAILAGMLDRSPPRLQGMAIGAFHFAYQLGMLGSAPLFGWIAERMGYSPMWWVAGSLVAASIVLYLVGDHIFGGRKAGETAQG